jgi:hypothetical protein
MATLNVSDLNRQGKVFTAANAAAVSVIAVAATQTGLVLYNPVGSGVKAILIEAAFSWTTAPAAVHNLGIGVLNANGGAIPTTATAATTGSADGSGNVGKVQAWNTAVFNAAPTARRWFGGAAYASGVSVNPGMMVDRIDGSIILVPGAMACLIGLTTTAVGVGSFVWAEVPA